MSVVAANMRGVNFLHHSVLERMHVYTYIYIYMICRYGAAFEKWALKKIKACYADAGVEVCFFSMLFLWGCFISRKASWHALTGAEYAIPNSFQPVVRELCGQVAQTHNGMWFNVNGMPFFYFVPTRKQYLRCLRSSGPLRWQRYPENRSRCG